MPSRPTTTPELTPERRREKLRQLLERKARQGRTYPLSLGQEALWVLDRLDPGRPTYGFYPAVRLRGPLDLDVVERCLAEILRRHDVLRTTYPEVNGAPVQRVAPFVSYKLPVLDLSDLPEAEREAEARRIVGERRPLDLQNGPVVRVQALRLGEDDHVVLLHIHHLAFDGWSTGLLGYELLALYPAFQAGRPSPLPELPIQYADFAVWQRQLMHSERLDQLRTHWRQRLDGLPPLDLATDYPRPSVRTSHGDTLPVTFSRELSEAVLGFSRRERVTPFMTLLAALQELLRRYSGQEDFAVGTPTANRRQRKVEPLVGYFINVLVLRADLHGDPSFRELVQRVRSTSLEAYEKQDLTLDQITEAVRPERDLSRHPLFQVMLILQNNPRPTVQLPDLEVVPLGAVEHARTAKFELTMPLRVTPAGLVEGNLNFNTDLFARATVQRMIAHYLMLLEDAMADPGRPLSRLPLLTATERRTVVSDWNVTARPLPEVVGVEQLFATHAARTPQAEAVVDGDRRWTYGELNESANRLARYLQRCGVEPEITVGICLERSAEFVLAVLAVLKAGGAYVPLDPTYSRDAHGRLRFILEDAGVSLVLANTASTDAVGGGEEGSSPTLVLLDRDGEAIAAESPADAVSAATPASLAYIVYTSGSTGRPKGVMVTRDNLLNAYCGWEHSYQLGELNTHLQMASAGFDVFSGDLARALGSGGKLVLCPKELLLSAPELLELMRRERVDIAEFVPVVMRNLVQHLEDADQQLDSLRLAIVGSDAWYVEDHRRTLAVLDPQARLVNSYGLTEATIDSSFFEGDGRALPETGMVPIGRPFANVRLYVLDAHRRPVPVGVAGELHVGGRGVARGYVNRPELAAERFVPDPFASVPGARLCRTGDRVRWRADGQIELLGRVDEQVKIRGFRIEPGEVEEVLREHPLLENATVLALERTPGDTQLVAYVAGRDETPPTVAEMRRFLGGRLPEYMIPAAFVVLDALPTTASGKVDRRALPDPDWRHLQGSGKGCPPKTETEKCLAPLWTEILGVERVGTEDNFFELGGNSLLAVRLGARIRAELSLNLPLVIMFTSPTLAGLAARIDELRASGQGSDLPTIPRAPRDAPVPLSFAQGRFWFVHRLASGTSALNLHAALPVSGPLDLAAFQETIRDVVRRHESLRTTFAETADGQAVQVVAPLCEEELLLVEDLSDLAEEERRERVSSLSREQAAAPFDLGRAPLFRLRLLRCGENEHTLLVTTTHLVFDGWSLQVLTREVAEIYDARRAGRPPSLPDLPVQYPDYSVWQQQYLRGDTMDRLLGYWRKQLADVPVLALPADHPRQFGAGGGKRWHRFHLPPALTARASRLCSEEGATTYMLLLAAFQLLLQRYCESDDIPVATPVANRRQPETHGMIGLFVNTVVMRGDLSGNPTFRDLLARVRQTALDAFAHQELTFERLVEDLQPERDLTRHPLAQVLFNFLQRPPGQRRLRRRELTIGRQAGEEHTVPGLFDLILSVTEGEDGYRSALQYDARLFEPDTIERMVSHFRNLLEQIVARPEWEIGRFELLGEDERRVLLEDWNRTEADFPRELCAHQLFEEQVRRNPEAVAVVSAHAEWSYLELNNRANRLAQRLRRAGVVADELVALCLERSLDELVAVLGILKSGGAYLPLDPRLPAERLRHMRQDAGVRVLITHDAVDTAWAVESADGELVVVRLEGEGKEGGEDCADLPPVATPTHLAFAIYTSGSTGRPKGAVIEHRSLVNVVTAYCRMWQIGPADRVLHNTSISFDVATNEIFMALSAGASVVLSDLPDRRDLIALTRLVRERGVTVLSATPTALARLNELPDPMPGVRLILSGGEVLSVGDVDQFLAHAVVVNGYGPSETTIYATCHVLPREATATDVAPPIGKPLANYKAYILDRHLRCVPVGCPGELCLGGVGLARGYLGDPEKTAAKFVPNPFVPGERIYHSGDRVRWLADGSIEFLGRIDRQVKIRGYRIELGEVEATLLSHPDVREATVIDWEAAPGDRRLAAYVVVPDGDPERIAGVRPFLAEKLPDYMVPSAIVPMEALPVNSNGKVDRSALPAPDLTLAASGSEYVAPRTPLEEQLSTLWCEVLGVDRVGVDDDFFARGGHSLLAVRLVALMSEALDAPIALAELFQAPTIARLAVRIDELRASGLGSDLPAIPQASREGPLPLSFAQKRFWFVHQLAPDTPILNLHVVLPISGALDIAAFRQTIQDIVQRHESLRTTFVGTADGQGAQVVAPFRHVELAVEDLSHLPEEEQKEQVSARSRERAATPFNLGRLPLFRLLLLRCGEDEHVLLVTSTHMVFDAWSIQILIREVAEVYDARSAGAVPSLPDLPVQYADYTVWQRQYLQGEGLASLLRYWRDQLANLPVLSLPTDHPRRIGAQGGKRWHRFQLAPALTARVARLCAAEGATPYMLMLTVLQLLLQRYSESDDVPVATPVANRRQAETHGMIGLFVNTVVMRGDLSGDPTFRELLARVRQTALDAFAHQELPFERLVEDLQPERDVTRHPLAQVLFNFLQRRDTPKRLRDRKLVMERPPSEEGGVVGLFDLTLSVVEGEHGYQSALQYDTRLFEPDTIERMADHFRNLLEQIVAHPEWEIGRFELLDEDERQQLTVEWNRTETEFPRDQCAHQLFEEQVRRTPDAVAAVAGDTGMSYLELNTRANGLAYRLRRLGARPDELVAMCVERSLDVPVALLGILKAGAAFLPLDPELPPERMRYMLRDADVRFLVVQEGADLAWPPEEIALVRIGDAGERAEDAANPEPAAGPESLAYAIYTSGSTGRPKGVLIEHRSLVNVITSFCRSYQLGPTDRVLHNTSISFDVAINEILPALSVGAAVVLSGRDERRDLSGLTRLVRQQGVTVLAAAPTALARLNELPDPLPGVRLILSGGEALSRSDVDRLLDTAMVVNGYGPTEATICATCHVLSAGTVEAEPILPIGKPLANYQAYILDRHLCCVPVGCPGELCLGGVGLARGYLGDPELTAAKFVPNPFVPGERIYRTGDRARWRADGNIEFLGRIDRQVKIRGYRIELGEVEAALLSHPDIREATVIDWEAAPGDKRLVAYIVAPGGGSEATAGVRSFLAEKLPDYMVPSVIVPMDALPVNSNGKVDRGALPAPDLFLAASANEYVAPRTPLEEQLSTLWCEVLGVDRIGVDDDFFARGGHSLLAVRLVALMSSALNAPVALAELFQAPTIARLAVRIDELRASGLGSDLPAIPQASREGPLPLSFAQERFWFVHQLAPDTPILNLHVALPISGALDIAAFRQTIQDIVQRHESLRTTFVGTADGQAAQVVAPFGHVELPVEDLSGLPEEERQEQLSARSRERAATPFDLSRLPLFRLLLLRCGEDEHVLLVTSTHMVFDAWSVQVLIREVAEAYDARCASAVPSLPDLPVQYADYTVWQRQYLQGEGMAALLGYWRDQLANLPVLSLPTDHRRQIGAQGGTRSHRFQLDPVLTARADRLCAAEGATPYMLMLTVFQLLLQRYSESDDVPVATPVANRRQAETHGMIGLFVNTVVMRGDLSGNPTFRELLARVRQTALDAFAHQELPFERLVEDLQPERDITRHPLAQVLFNFLQRSDTHRRLGHRKLVMERPPSEEGGMSSLFDLTLSVVEGKHGYQSALKYRARLFEPDTIERMANHFRNLLEQIVAHPEWEIGRFELLDEDERRVLLEDWNRTEADFPRELCAHQLFEEQVRRDPEAVAMVSANAEWSYLELNSRANRLAQRLRRAGVVPDELVAFCLERSPDELVAVLGILKSGGAYLPLDPKLPAERLRYMRQDAGARVLITHDAVDTAWAEGSTSGELTVVRLGGDTGESGECCADPQPVATPTHLAYAIYTSGSTGHPKGVMIEHRSLVNVVTAYRRMWQIGPADRVLHNTSISFDVATKEIFMALSTGASVVLSDLPDRRDLIGLTRLVRERGVTVLSATPTALARLNELPDPMPGVRLILSGGEALSVGNVDQFLAHAVVFNGYGPSETTITATCHMLPREATATDVAPPIGKPLANYKAYILDRHLRCVPVGCPGELCLGGVGLARGYLGDPEKTAAKFVPNPFVPGERIYHTGDRVRWQADGNIEFLGRIDRQVKIRGYRIELGEVEVTLLSHPDVREATVIDWEAAPGDRRLAAYVVVPDGDPERIAGLRPFLAEKLPDYMVPSAIVPMDALPVNSNGKVDRSALPAPDLALAASGSEYVAPRTPLEEQLSTLWCEVLGVDRIGVDDDFFARGGHSLLAVRLVALMSEALDAPVALMELFQGPTIAGLSERLAARDAERQAFDPPLTAGSGVPSFTLETVPGCVSLVRLADAPSGRPVFIMPGLGGLVFGFLPLAMRLAVHRPVYALQAQGLVAGQHAHESYADMAASYLKEIRMVQPHGPYLLGGWSMGGMVAVEAAQQLRAVGEDAALVAMLDTHIIQPRILPGFVANAAVMRWIAPLVGVPARELAGLVAKEKWGEIAQRLGLPQDSGGEQARCFTAMCRADLCALSSYKPVHYAGRTVLLQREHRRRLPSRRERRLFPELHCEQVQGNHYSMLREPHVDALAECLQRYLEECDRVGNEGY